MQKQILNPWTNKMAMMALYCHLSDGKYLAAILYSRREWFEQHPKNHPVKFLRRCCLQVFFWFFFLFWALSALAAILCNRARQYEQFWLRSVKGTILWSWLKMGQWIKRFYLKGFFSSGSHLVQQSRMVVVILVVDLSRNNLMKFGWNLPRDLYRRCCF